MAFSLRKAIRLFDDFGHSIKMTYKGSETYQSLMGGVISIAVMTFTMAMVISKLEQVVLMTDPIITSFPRALTDSDREELGELRFTDTHFNIGYRLGNLPPEVGRFVALHRYADGEEMKETEVDTVDCREILSQQILDRTSRHHLVESI